MARMVEGQGRTLTGRARIAWWPPVLALAALLCIGHVGARDVSAQGISGDLIVLLNVPGEFSTPAANSTITVEVLTNNISVNTAAPSTTRIYLSTSSVFDRESARLVASQAIPELPGRTERLDHVQVPLPVGHVGLRYLFAEADADNTVNEGNESNNLSTQTVAITIGGDLTVSIDVPGGITELPAGATVNVKDFTRSINSAPVAASTTSFYMVRGDGTEIWLGSRDVGPLTPSGTSEATTPLTLPATEAGTFRIIAKADALDAILEINENNNVSAPSAPFTLGPDLVAWLDVPAASRFPKAGVPISVTAIARNNGLTLAPPSTVELYYSAVGTFDGTATLVASRGVRALGPKEEEGPGEPRDISFTLPPADVGVKYLYLKANANGAVAEYNGGNNVSAPQIITIGGDLRVVSLDVPGNLPGGSPLIAGATIGVADWTRNDNGAPVAESTTSFYLIRGTTLDGTETLLGSRSVPALDPSTTHPGTTPLTLPLGAAGTFRIIAKANAGITPTPEINTSNNLSAPSAAFTLGPDLAVDLDVLAGSKFPGAGKEVTVNTIARNNAPTEAPPSTVRLYYSEVGTFDEATAAIVGSRAVPALRKGTDHRESITFTLPAADVGVRYLYVKIDPDGLVPESNEGNNVSAPQIITIGGDLRVVSLDVPGNLPDGSPLIAGATIGVADWTRNDNAAPVAESTTSFYLIRGTTLDGTETLLGSRSVPALDPSTTHPGTTPLTLPLGAAGTFRIIAKANAGITPTPEINTSNNLSAPSAAFTLGPDLAVDLDVPAGSKFPGAGKEVTVNTIARNNAPTTAPASTVRLYYSEMGTFDEATAAIVGSRPVPTLAKGTSHPESISFTLPATDVGVRYLYVKIDPDGLVPESNEGNNVSAPQTITIGGDLVVSISIGGGAIDRAPGAPIKIMDTTRRNNSAPVGASTTKVYLITGTTLDDNAVLLYSRDIPAFLSTSKPNSKTTDVTLPADAVGRFRIIARTDADDAAIEIDEDNNLSAPSAPFMIGPDLTVLGITVPRMALPGARIDVNDVTKNLGAGDAPSSRTGYYLSHDAVLGPDDVLLGRRALNGLAGREQDPDGSTTVDIPGTTAPGCYFIIANADDEDVVREVDETNNASTHNVPATRIQVRPSSDVTLACAQSDFDGDGKSDILWRDTSHTMGIWLMDGATLRSAGVPATVDETWTSQGTGDFNGDGKVDVLWRHDSGMVGVWLMNGTTLTTAAAVETATLDWTIHGVGDFNADGKADVLWQDATGLVGIWLMSGTALASAAAVDTAPAGWTIQGVGDFNGDGKADILWRDADGLVSLWLMNGLTVATAQAAGSRAPEWTIQGVGDFNGDGKADVLWRDTTTGAVEVWLMDGAAIASAGPASAATLDWTIQGVGDFNGDGKADVLWRNDTGMVAAWFMNGASIGSIGVSQTADLSWTIE